MATLGSLVIRLGVDDADVRTKLAAAAQRIEAFARSAGVAGGALNRATVAAQSFARAATSIPKLNLRADASSLTRDVGAAASTVERLAGSARASIPITADTDDFTRDVKRASASVDKLAGADVKLRADASGLRREVGQAGAAVERLARSATASIPITADTAAFTRDVQRATASVGKLAGANVTLRADASGLMREVGPAEAAVARYVSRAKAAEKVRLDADASGVVREANRAAEAVQRLTDRATAFQNVGRNLSIGVTAPLVALGGASLVSAGRLESLQIGMEAITGSAKEAETQIARLQEIAKAPGIGFEQAIKGSIQLQSVQLSAELAERALAGVARAVALGGGGEEQFGGVLRQLQQVASAGKLMGDELMIIKENAPAIAPALEAAFGSSSAESIRALGLTTEEFFERLAMGLETLPQVSGGLANSFENLRQAATRALAALISDDERKRITAAITALSARIESAAAAFSALPTPVRVGAIALGIAAAATGPVLIGLGLLIRSYRTFVGVSIVSTLGAQAKAFLALAFSVRSANDAVALLGATAPRTMAFVGGAAVASGTFVKLALSVRSVSDATALIGAAAVPLTRFLAPVLGGAVAFGKLALSVRSVPAAVALFGAAFPGVSAAIGAVVSAAAGIAAAFTAPVALAVAAVVGLGVAVYVFRDEIGGAFQAVGGFLRTVGEQFVTFGALVIGVVIYPFIRAWEQARDAFGGVLRGIANYASNKFDEIGATVERWRVRAIASVRAAWAGMVASFRGSEIVQSVTGTFDAVTGYLARQVAVFSAAGNRLVNGLIRGIADTARKLPGLGPVVADRIETLLGGAGQVAVANAAGARVAKGFAVGVARVPAVRIAPPVAPVFDKARMMKEQAEIRSRLEQATEQVKLLSSALGTLPKGSAAFANATKQATALQAKLAVAIGRQGSAVTDVSVGYQDAANQLAKAMNPDAPKELTRATQAATRSITEATDATAGLTDQFRQFQALRDLGVSDLTKLPAGLREAHDEAERLRREYTDLLATLATPGVVVPPGFDVFAQSLRTNLEAADREVQTRVAGMARALRDGLPVDLSLQIDAAPAVGAVETIRSAAAVAQGAFADLSRRASAGMGGTADAVARARDAVAQLAEQLENVSAAPGIDLTALRAGLEEGRKLLAGLDGPAVPTRLASLGPALAGAVRQVADTRPVLDVTARIAPLGPLLRDLDRTLQAGTPKIALDVGGSAAGVVERLRSSATAAQAAFADLTSRASKGLGGTAEAVARAREAVARLADQLANVRAAPGIDLTTLRTQLAEGQRLLAGLENQKVQVPVQLASLRPALAGAIQQVDSARPVLDVTARLAPLGPLLRNLDKALQVNAPQIVLNVPAPATGAVEQLRSAAAVAQDAFAELTRRASAGLGGTEEAITRARDAVARLGVQLANVRATPGVDLAALRAGLEQGQRLLAGLENRSVQVPVQLASLGPLLVGAERQVADTRPVMEVAARLAPLQPLLRDLSETLKAGAARIVLNVPAPAVGAVEQIRNSASVAQRAFADLAQRAAAGLGGTEAAVVRTREAVKNLAEQLASVQAAPGVDLTALRAGLAEGQRLLAVLDGPTVPVHLASLEPVLAGAAQQIESASPVLEVAARLATLGPLFRDLDDKLQAGAAGIVLNVPAPKIVGIAEVEANMAARAMDRAGSAFGTALQDSIRGIAVVPLSDTDRLVQSAQESALVIRGAIAGVTGGINAFADKVQRATPIQAGVAELSAPFAVVGGLLRDFARVLPASLSGVAYSLAAGAFDIAASVAGFGPQLEAALGPLAKPVNAVLGGLAIFAGATVKAAGVVGGVVAGIGSQLLAIFNPFKIVASLLDEAFRAIAPSIEVLQEPVAEIARILSAALVPVLNALTPVFQSLVPVIQSLAPVISGVGQVLGALFKPLIPVIGALVPLFRAFFPVFKLLAVIVTYTGQALFKMGAIALDVIGAIAVGFGKIVEGIARAVDKLPGISAKGAIQAGKDIQNYGRAVGLAADGFRDAADALGVARKEIKAIELDDSLATAAGGAASALVAFSNTLSDQTQLRDLLAGVFDIDDSPLVKLQGQLDLLARFAPDLASPFAGLDVATEAGRVQIEEALRNLALMIASGTIPEVKLGNLESIAELITLVSGADSALDELTKSTLAQADAARDVTEALTNIPEIFDLTQRRMQALIPPGPVVPVVPVAPEVLAKPDPLAALETFRRLLLAIPTPEPLNLGWTEPPAIHPGWRIPPPTDLAGFIPTTPVPLPIAPPSRLDPREPREAQPSGPVTFMPGAIVVQGADDARETARAVVSQIVGGLRRGGVTELELALMEAR